MHWLTAHGCLQAAYAQISMCCWLSVAVVIDITAETSSILHEDGPQPLCP